MYYIARQTHILDQLWYFYRIIGCAKGSEPVIGKVREIVRCSPGLVQLAKFCVVGLSSFIIDAVSFNILSYRLHVPLLIAKTITFMFGVTNGFIWNRRWTFQKRSGNAAMQYPKFVITNMIGLVLNLSIMTGTLVLAARTGFIRGDFTPSQIPSMLLTAEGRKAFDWIAVNTALIVATFFVTTWNFTAARLITFRD